MGGLLATERSIPVSVLREVEKVCVNRSVISAGTESGSKAKAMHKVHE